jgi:hypothetical protein
MRSSAIDPTRAAPRSHRHAPCCSPIPTKKITLTDDRPGGTRPAVTAANGGRPVGRPARAAFVAMLWCCVLR